MKVKDFIEVLKEFNKEAEVIFVNDLGASVDYDDNPGWSSPDLGDDWEDRKRSKKETDEVVFFLEEGSGGSVTKS